MFKKTNKITIEYYVSVNEDIPSHIQKAHESLGVKNMKVTVSREGDVEGGGWASHSESFVFGNGDITSKEYQLRF